MKTFPIVTLLLFLTAASCDDDDAAMNIPDIQSKVTVKMQVGTVLYENVDAVVKADAFDASGNLQWSNNFEYTGATDDSMITIPAGYDHYALTATTGGASDSQTISGTQLYNDRADGESPTSYVFAPFVAAPRVKSVIRSLETETVMEMEPYMKQEYDWVGDVLLSIHEFDYNAETEIFSPARYFLLFYDNARVVKIQGFHTDEVVPYIETVYEYNPNGTVAQITETNSASGVSTQADLVYDNDNQMVTATYSISNGGSFVYRYAHEWKNLTWDETKKGSTVCNEGVYGYDKKINPYRHLGFVDLFLTYTSVNNKTTEDVDYMACSFPEMELVENTYTYNEKGYPLTKTLLYSNGKHGLDEFTY